MFYVAFIIISVIILLRQLVDWKCTPNPRPAAGELAEPLYSEALATDSLEHTKIITNINSTTYQYQYLIS